MIDTEINNNVPVSASVEIAFHPAHRRALHLLYHFLRCVARDDSATGPGPLRGLDATRSNENGHFLASAEPVDLRCSVRGDDDAVDAELQTGSLFLHGLWTRLFSPVLALGAAAIVPPLPARAGSRRGNLRLCIFPPIAETIGVALAACLALGACAAKQPDKAQPEGTNQDQGSPATGITPIVSQPLGPVAVGSSYSPAPAAMSPPDMTPSVPIPLNGASAAPLEASLPNAPPPGPMILQQGQIGTAQFAPTSEVVTIEPADEPAVVGNPNEFSYSAPTPLSNFAYTAPQGGLDLSHLAQLIGGGQAGGLPLTVNFLTGSSYVSDDQRPSLALAAGWAATYSNVSLLVIGMASPPGGFGMNQELGMDRALSVASILIADGVPSSRVSTRSMGIVNPAASGQSQSDWYEDQRVVVVPGVPDTPNTDMAASTPHFLGCPNGPITQSLCDLR